MRLLEVAGLIVQFPGPTGMVAALDGVDFTLEPGQVLGIVGASGSGKSVTALSLLRLIPKPGAITGGKVLFEGRDLLALPAGQMAQIRGRGLFLIFQSPRSTLNPTRTIGRQVMEVLTAPRRRNRRHAREEAEELLVRVGIPTSRFRSYPFQLSGGMQQRVLIAMALALHPKILIADEPTTGLDVITQREILELLRDWCTALQMALILITHDFRVIASLARETLVMDQGRVAERGETARLLSEPQSPVTVQLIEGARRLAS